MGHHLVNPPELLALSHSFSYIVPIKIGISWHLRSRPILNTLQQFRSWAGYEITKRPIHQTIVYIPMIPSYHLYLRYKYMYIIIHYIYVHIMKYHCMLYIIYINKPLSPCFPSFCRWNSRKNFPNPGPTAPHSILTPRPPRAGRSERGRRRQLADLQPLRRVLRRVDLLPEGHRSPWHRMGRTLQRGGNHWGHGTYIVNYIHGKTVKHKRI